MLWANGSYYRSYSNLGQMWLDKNEHISSMFVSHMLFGKSTTEFHISYYSMFLLNKGLVSTVCACAGFSRFSVNLCTFGNFRIRKRHNNWAGPCFYDG